MNITRRQLLKYSAALAAASAIGLDLALPKELMGAEADVDRWSKASAATAARAAACTSA